MFCFLLFSGDTAGCTNTGCGEEEAVGAFSNVFESIRFVRALLCELPCTLLGTDVEGCRQLRCLSRNGTFRGARFKNATFLKINYGCPKTSFINIWSWGITDAGELFCPIGR